MKMKKIRKTIVALLGCFAGMSANASFIGNEVQLTYHYPNLYTDYDSEIATVDTGVELVDFIGNFDVDISDTNITVSQFNKAATWGSNIFNGWALTDINGTIDDILSVTINSTTNMIGLDASRLIFDGNSISINWEGLSYTMDTVVSLDIEFKSTAVPTPTSSALLGLGLIGFGFYRKRKIS